MTLRVCIPLVAAFAALAADGLPTRAYPAKIASASAMRSRPRSLRARWASKLSIRRAGPDVEAVKLITEQALARVARREIENDGFNRLVIPTGLTAREIVVLRAYCRYLLQTGVPFSQVYMERTLAANAATTTVTDNRALGAADYFGADPMSWRQNDIRARPARVGNGRRPSDSRE